MVKAVLVIFVFLLVLCSNKDINPLGTDENVEQKKALSGWVKLENPYEIKNFNQAKKSLEEKGVLRKTAEVLPTHAYVMFSPMTDYELSLLLSDSRIKDNIWFYPVDYEGPDGATEYPYVENGATCNVWTIIPYGSKGYPPVRMDLICYLYIPPEELLKSELDYRAIEKESFRLTGNEYGLPSDGLSKTALSSWYPSGNISVYDKTKERYVPVKNATVRARFWFRWTSMQTDNNGNFNSSKRFYSLVNYSICWSNPSFAIRGVLWPQFYNGPRKSGKWNLQLMGGGGVSWEYATVHQALDFYATEAPKIFGINSVPFRGLTVYVRPGQGECSYSSVTNKIVLHQSSPGGYVYIWKSHDRKMSVWHEAAHAHHARIFNGVYASHHAGEQFVPESWACAVAWKFLMHEYSTDGPKAAYYTGPWWGYMYQDYPLWGTKAHNGLLIDLMDTENGTGLNKYVNYYDYISGYRLKDLETVIKRNDVRDRYSLISKIKTVIPLPSGVTSAALNNYLQYYIPN